MRYSAKLINGNGYTIDLKSNSLDGIKSKIKFYPLKSFFIWVYDTKKDEMIYQNNWSDKLKKCNNETFISYN